MKKIVYLSLLFLLISNLLFSQIAINADGSPPHQSAGLDISYPDKGILLPRLSLLQRNSIQEPAEGLIIFCTDCSNAGQGVISIYQGGGWKIIDFKCYTPDTPVTGSQIPDVDNIEWNWDAEPLATGYKWNVINDLSTANDLGDASSFYESDLTCNHSYTRYVWAYNNCGHSQPLILTQSTLDIPLAISPVEADHLETRNTIEWKWNPVTEATGYKLSSENDLENALDLGNITSYTEFSLTCGTNYTRYVWAYNSCGVSEATTINTTTSAAQSARPAAALHIPTNISIEWKWRPAFEATGYKWNTVDNYSTATDLGTDTSYTQTYLFCLTSYTCYVWAYNDCAVSYSRILTQSTLPDTHPSASEASHIPSITQIIWNWHPVPNGHPSFYKISASNDFGSATNVGTDTTFTETVLTCNTSYTRYVWAYDDCAIAEPVILTKATLLNPPAFPAAGNHIPSPNQIIWVWNVVEGAAGYKWSMYDNYNGAEDMGIATAKIQTGLTCNTPYVAFIWAYNNCGVSISSSLSQRTSLNPPPAPTPAEHFSFPTLIVWNWNPVAGAAGYKWGTTNDIATALDLGNSTTKTETGLSCNNGYTRYVWAYNPCGESIATALVKMTAVDPPASPMGLTHNPSPFQVIWNWSSVNGAMGYLWNTVNDTTNAEDMGMLTSKTEDDLDCSTNYIRYIWAYNDCGVSAVTNMAQATSLYPPGSPVAAVHVPSATQIVWKWRQVNGATSYAWNSINDFDNATELNGDTTITQPGLSCNTSYNCFVWAISSCGVSSPAQYTQLTSLNPPASPAQGTHVPAAAQVEWKWNTVSGATGYKWGITDNYDLAQNMFASTSFIETTLNCNTPYTRYVWAYSNCGVSSKTTITSTTLIQVPAAPAIGTHTATNTQIVWNWNTVPGATGYKWGTSNNYASATNMGAVNTLTENNLSCGTSYTRYVWAYNNCANSVVTILTKSTASVPPAAPVAGSHVPSSDQISWNWSAVSGATNYKWSTTNDIAGATDLGNVTSFTETGLNCATSYTRYLWASNGCSNSASITLNQTTSVTQPATPVATTHDVTASTIIWHWNVVPDAVGYKWGLSGNYTEAANLGNVTSNSESNLNCNTSYIRYLWAYNNCGVSTPLLMAQTTANDPPPAPTAGTHNPSLDQIIWIWNAAPGANGYKWNSTNDLVTAIDLGSLTTYTHTGLSCGESYSCYVWAYSNNCGTSLVAQMTNSTDPCFACGTTLVVNHVAGTVAPVTKTTSYVTVTNVPGETSKCWITSNLGSDHQATAVNDNTEASAGWYWQFNRMQGYKHDGTSRTPTTTWITSINEYSNWVVTSDPCTLELGNGWRLPTVTEWTNVDNGGSWSNWNGPWNSLLKMHAAGYLYYSTGALQVRGSQGGYWGSVQTNNSNGFSLYFTNNSCTNSNYPKSFGYTIRCITD